MVGHGGGAVAASYGCACHGLVAGRSNAQRSEPYLRAIEAFTGFRITGCPWRALDNPLVSVASTIYSHYETGNLSAFLTRDDPEVVWQAVALYISVSSRIRSKQFEEQQEKIKAQHGK